MRYFTTTSELARFDVDVTRAALERSKDDRIDESDYRAHTPLSRVSLSIEIFSSLSSSSPTTCNVKPSVA